MEHTKDNQDAEKNAYEICERIRLDVAAEIEGITSSARREATRILEEARHAAGQEKESLTKQYEQDSNLLRERLFSAINLEKRKIILGAKNVFIETVLARVRDIACAYRSRPGYRDFLINAASEGVVAVGAERVEVVCSALDEALLGESFRKAVCDRARVRLGYEITVTFTSDVFSDIGCLVRSSDGHLICDNRFMARFARIHEELRMKLLEEAV
ncbi:MAG: V-type ATP synthase subunit E family protein [Candidatus Omnitrophota bacterium]